MYVEDVEDISRGHGTDIVSNNHSAGGVRYHVLKGVDRPMSAIDWFGVK